jgi:hypothetical protein
MDMAAIPALDSQRQSSIAPIVCVKKCEIDVRNREKATKKSETFISLTWRQLQNVNTHTREQAARQRTDTSVEADEERHRCR